MIMKLNSSPSLLASPQLHRTRLVVRARSHGERQTSTFENTSSIVKWLVTGLTNVVNTAIPRQVVVEDNGVRGAITPEEVYAGVRSDFMDKCYLWTGEISEHIYAESCVFTDPTLSFTGLQTFKRNVTGLKPILDCVLATRSVELLSCELLKDRSCVVARWRMTGSFRLPWRPVLDLMGQTTYSYAPEDGNRVVRYDEQWGVSAADALLQLLRPGPKPMR